jgi:hypothetical protein
MPQWGIRRGDANSYTETHIAFIIGAPIAVGAFVGAIISARSHSGAASDGFGGRRSFA